MKSHEALVQSILKHVGGEKNIEQVWNCTTRLRFIFYNPSLVQEKELKNVKGVLGTQVNGNQFQIIIGNDVGEVYQEIEKKVSAKGNVKAERASAPKKTNIVGAVLETIAGIFTPILPAIIGAGMMKCVLSIFTVTGLVSDTNGLFIIFQMISDAAFYFLPFLIAVSASRKFRVNEYIGLFVAGVLMYPTLINGAAVGLEPIKLFIFDVPYLDYSSSVVPIILGVWLLSYVYRFMEKIIPNVFRFILTPLLSMTITVPILLVVLAPLGNYIGNYMAIGLDWLFITVGPVAGFVLSALNPLLVMTGMHFTIMPIAIQNLAAVGYDNFWLPFCLISNLAQAGAIFAVFFKLRNKEEKSVALSTAVSAVFGITEPGMFGVTFKLKKPFFAAMLAGGTAGLIGVFLGVRTYAFSAPNIFAIPTYIAPDGNMKAVVAIVISCFISFVLAFVFTLFLKLGTLENPNGKDQPDPEADDVAPSAAATARNLAKKVEIKAPVRGTIASIDKVPDSTFADEIIGIGVAIEPTEGKIYAPFDGEIIMTFRTKHALAFRSAEGIEVLVHIGIDTVALDGSGFNLFKENNTPVNAGDVVGEFDLEGIKAQGYNVITPVMVTNYSEFKAINKEPIMKQVDETQTIMEVVGYK